MTKPTIKDQIEHHAMHYEQITGTRPEKVYLTSGVYGLYWDSFSFNLLEIVNISDEEQALGFSRTPS
jgi:hypothetical protein